jgi:hypothetical protein
MGRERSLGTHNTGPRKQNGHLIQVPANCDSVTAIRWCWFDLFVSSAPVGNPLGVGLSLARDGCRVEWDGC